jgi:hypothetical protein
MNMQTSIAVVDVVDVVAVVPVVPVVPVGRLGGRAFCSVPPARVAGSSFTYAERSASKAPGPRGMCVGSYVNRSGWGGGVRGVMALVGVVT